MRLSQRAGTFSCPVVAELITAIRTSTNQCAGATTTIEAEILLAGLDGLATRLLLRQSEADHVIALVDHQIDRLTEGDGK